MADQDMECVSPPSSGATWVEAQSVTPPVSPRRPPNPKYAGRGSLSPRLANRLSLSPRAMDQDPVISFESLELTPTLFSPTPAKRSQRPELPEPRKKAENKKPRGFVRTVKKYFTPKRTDKSEASPASTPMHGPPTSKITPAPVQKTTRNLPRSRSLPLPAERDAGGRIKTSKTVGKMKLENVHMENELELADERTVFKFAWEATERAEKLKSQANDLNKRALMLQEEAKRVSQERDEMLARNRARAHIRDEASASPTRRLRAGAKYTIQKPFNLSTGRNIERGRRSSLDLDCSPKPFKAKPMPDFTHGNRRHK